ncbi:MAG: hypothetical protein PHX43_07195 [Alphaproteobacteria bacterium]|nr:hypothetical protein [Alphaproteobacteria bacterium]
MTVSKKLKALAVGLALVAATFTTAGCEVTDQKSENNPAPERIQKKEVAAQVAATEQPVDMADFNKKLARLNEIRADIAKEALPTIEKKKAGLLRVYPDIEKWDMNALIAQQIAAIPENHPMREKLNAANKEYKDNLKTAKNPSEIKNIEDDYRAQKIAILEETIVSPENYSSPEDSINETRRQKVVSLDNYILLSKTQGIFQRSVIISEDDMKTAIKNGGSKKGQEWINVRTKEENKIKGSDFSNQSLFNYFATQQQRDEINSILNGNDGLMKTAENQYAVVAQLSNGKLAVVPLSALYKNATLG